jgi:hypothetical protein
VPEPLEKHLRPRLNLAQLKENPAKIAQQRMTYMEHIKLALRCFDALNTMDPDDARKYLDSTLVLMHKRMRSGFSNKRLLVQNQ